MKKGCFFGGSEEAQGPQEQSHLQGAGGCESLGADLARVLREVESESLLLAVFQAPSLRTLAHALSPLFLPCHACFSCPIQFSGLWERRPFLSAHMSVNQEAEKDKLQSRAGSPKDSRSWVGLSPSFNPLWELQSPR